MRLEFYEWECGHHQDTPDSIEVSSEEQAEAILCAISHAISQPGRAMAQLINDGMTKVYYLTDDYLTVHRDWQETAA